MDAQKRAQGLSLLDSTDFVELLADKLRDVLESGIGKEEILDLFKITEGKAVLLSQLTVHFRDGNVAKDLLRKLRKELSAFADHQYALDRHGADRHNRYQILRLVERLETPQFWASSTPPDNQAAIEDHPKYDAEKQKSLNFKNDGNSWNDLRVNGMLSASTVSRYAKATEQEIVGAKPGRPRNYRQT